MMAAENIPPQPARVLLMHGSFDTLKDHPGADYSSVSVPDIEVMAREPATTDKRRAPCVIFSTYVGHDGRSHQTQAEFGEFIALPGDVDQGNAHIAEVDAAIVAVYGDVRRLIYSTASATPRARKWRYILPLAEPIPGSVYTAAQLAAFDLMREQDITCDRALSRPGQVACLPNVPADKRDDNGVPLFYNHEVRGSELFSLSGSAIEARMMERQRAEEQAREAVQEAARACAENRQEKTTGSTLPSPIDAFNAATRIEDILQQYGYRRRGHDWQSKYQGSGSYATQIMDGGHAWVSMSESDAAAGLGTRGANGGCWGDAFDLFKHYEHGGDQSAALVAAANSIRLPDGRTLDQARADQWREEKRKRTDRMSDDLLLGRTAEQATDDRGEAPGTLALEPITLDELNNARLTPRVILRDLLYADVRVRISAGGTGKTTLALFEAVTLALCRPLYGRQPDGPCRTVIVTREDSREILVARLREIMKAMELTPARRPRRDRREAGTR